MEGKWFWGGWVYWGSGGAGILVMYTPTPGGTPRVGFTFGFAATTGRPPAGVGECAHLAKWMRTGVCQCAHLGEVGLFAQWPSGGELTWWGGATHQPPNPFPSPPFPFPQTPFPFPLVYPWGAMA